MLKEHLELRKRNHRFKVSHRSYQTVSDTLEYYFQTHIIRNAKKITFI